MEVGPPVVGRGTRSCSLYSPPITILSTASARVKPTLLARRTFQGDRWPGIESLFVPGREILLAEGPRDVLGFLTDISERERSDIASRALKRILRNHTSARRAQEFEEIRQQVAA